MRNVTITAAVIAALCALLVGQLPVESAAAERATTEQKDPRDVQKHPAAGCGEDPVCLKAWYDEYRATMLDELQFWREFEDDVALRNADATITDFRSAHESHEYRHYVFDFYKGYSVRGIPDKDLRALVDSCRTAILDMKWMLLQVGKDEPLMEGDPGDYLKNVAICERRFKLPVFRSALRKGRRS